MVVNRLSSVVSANRVVASGWIEVSFVVSAVRERERLLFLFVLFFMY